MFTYLNGSLRSLLLRFLFENSKFKVHLNKLASRVSLEQIYKIKWSVNEEGT